MNYTNGGSGPFDITTTINGARQTFNNEPLQKVVINSGDGNDTISVEGSDGNSEATVAIGVAITAGNGNDNVSTSIGRPIRVWVPTSPSTRVTAMTR